MYCHKRTNLYTWYKFRFVLGAVFTGRVGFEDMKDLSQALHDKGMCCWDWFRTVKSCQIQQRHVNFKISWLIWPRSSAWARVCVGHFLVFEQQTKGDSWGFVRWLLLWLRFGCWHRVATWALQGGCCWWVVQWGGTQQQCWVARKRRRYKHINHIQDIKINHVDEYLYTWYLL